MASPLDGVRVVDLSRLLPGPFASLALADLGADVIKIEAPGAGDYLRNMPPSKGGASGAYWILNRGKRSVELNLKSADGRDAFLEIVRDADVVLESFRPGVLDRLGVGFAALKAVNPRIILCSISGYGQDGPYADRAGHDINYCALAGVLALGGERDGRPALPGVQIADIGGGALWAVAGINAALFARERNGEGGHVDISMTEGALTFAAAHIGYADCGGPTPTRGQDALNGGLACYGIYEAADGKFLAVGALEPKFWIAFNQAIGRAANPAELIAPRESQEGIRDEVAAILATRSRDAWMETLGKVDCCVEPVLELSELAEHPLHATRMPFFRQSLEGYDQSIVALRLPLGEAARDRLAPKHGEHTDDFLDGDKVKPRAR